MLLRTPGGVQECSSAFIARVPGWCTVVKQSQWCCSSSFCLRVDLLPKGVLAVNKYECGVCGYVYDPEKGDKSRGIASGTKFEDLPEDWTCPICGASKDQFQKM